MVLLGFAICFQHFFELFLGHVDFVVLQALGELLQIQELVLVLIILDQLFLENVLEIILSPPFHELVRFYEPFLN